MSGGYWTRLEIESRLQGVKWSSKQDDVESSWRITTVLSSRSYYQ